MTDADQAPLILMVRSLHSAANESLFPYVYPHRSTKFTLLLHLVSMHSVRTYCGPAVINLYITFSKSRDLEDLRKLTSQSIQSHLQHAAAFCCWSGRGITEQIHHFLSNRIWINETVNEFCCSRRFLTSLIRLCVTIDKFWKGNTTAVG